MEGARGSRTQLEVVAKLSFHALREERSFQVCKSLSKSVDPEGRHIVRPIDLLRLPGQQGDPAAIVVAIFEDPGFNDLNNYIDFGPAWYRSPSPGEEGIRRPDNFAPSKQISVPSFLDFAIGATECLEILHHGQRIVHGEIRGDAFHFKEGTGQVRLINFGSGLRSFEHGLTSTGWSTLSKEYGAKNKLSFISPEQTGRMPAEPDSRTDIYSLGILFWTLLTQQPAFDGPSPMDIIQAVLGRRLPSVSTVRMDVPDVIGRLIQKMTSKSISERYHSASGLKYDLLEIQKYLGHGDSETLGSMKIASRDISSYFILPTIMIGRTQEQEDIVKVIEKVSKRHIESSKQGVHSLSSGFSSSSNSGDPVEALDNVTQSLSDSLSDSFDSNLGVRLRKESSHGSIAGGYPGDGNHSAASSSKDPHSTESTRSNVVFQPREKDRNMQGSVDLRSSVPRSTDGSSMSIDAERSRGSEGAGSLVNQKNHQKFSRRGRCEVVSISGAAGLGKSCLVQSVQIEARRRGYFASSKFDQARKAPFGPVLKLLTSLFKQVFSESETETQFNQMLKQYVRPAWPMLHKVLELPEFLLGQPQLSIPQHMSHASSVYNQSIRSDMKIQSRGASSSTRSSSFFNMNHGLQTPQDFLRSGSTTKSTRLINTFLDVLRVFCLHKFICFCLDDLQFADEESLELITQLISSRMKMVIIVTYRPDEILPEKIKSVIEPPNTEGIRELSPFA